MKTVYLSLYLGGTVVNNPSANAGDARDVGLIPGLGRSPGKHGNPLQHSYLENPTDRGTWQATACGVTRVGHDLATKLLLLKFTLEKKMATHSSILA